MDAPPSIPLNAGIVQGHLLCAGEEFPLVGCHNVTDLLYMSQDRSATAIHNVLTDHALFGSELVYSEAIEHLLDRGHLWSEAANKLNGLAALSTHPVSVTSPLQYFIHLSACIIVISFDSMHS